MNVSIIRASLILAIFLPLPALAQATQAPAAPEYKPGLADLMLNYIQPRHAKIGLAGAAANWDLAMFSVTELTHAFERAGKQVPKWKQLLIPEMTAAVIDPAIGSLVKAIKSKDAAAFQRGYRELTNGCNSCHASAQLGFIHIQEPAQSSYPNQEFAPVKR